MQASVEKDVLTTLKPFSSLHHEQKKSNSLVLYSSIRTTILVIGKDHTEYVESNFIIDYVKWVTTEKSQYSGLISSLTQKHFKLAVLFF